MTKIRWIAGAALSATLAAAAFAAAPDGPPKTRAEVQAKVAEHFKKADTNSDGFVTKAEVDATRAAMKAKWTERRGERRAEHFAKLDADKNGALSKEEFAAPRERADHGGHRGGPDGMRGHGGHRGHGMMGHHGGMGMGGMWFERADANKDGKVSLAEASAGALAMFDKVDTDKNGTISSAEHEAARDAMRAKWKEHRGERADKRG